MELRALALRILDTPTLEAKLAPPADPLTDEAPGAPLAWDRPARPPELVIRTKKTRVAMPRAKASTLANPRKRALCLHFFANHELQALELMAYALLAWPDAPRAFRRGVAETLGDEQRHLALYLARMADLGLGFGEVPVTDYFWAQSTWWRTPLDYVAALSLGFEGGNLDRAPIYEDLFRAAGDEPTAALMRRVHDDEVGHVRFGLLWLRRWKDPARTDFEVFAEHLRWPLRPSRTRGPVVRRSSRRAAGLDEDFLDRLEAARD
jgi:uncharacterized ferritin-like protein (DUF455 family)